MTDAVRELFEMLSKKEKSGSDYTGRVTRVEGNTAYVQFDGSDIPDTPVALSIGAKAGDEVRVRVADGRAWITGNDTAPPADGSRTELVESETKALHSVVTNGDNLVSIINQTAEEVQIQAEKIQLKGYTKIDQGELGGFVSRKGDTGCQNKTTANGGHRYPTSLYKQMSDSTYEYEVGIKGDSSGVNPQNNLAFYLKRMAKNGTWSSAADMFYVNNSGKLYSQNAVFENTLKMTNGSMVAQMTGSELQFTDTRSAFSDYLHKISGIAISSWDGNKYAQMSGGNIACKSADAAAYANMYNNCVEVGYTDGTYNRFGRFTATASGNIGLYDADQANYIIYSDTDFKVRVPHQFLCYGADEDSTTQRVPVGSSNTANQGVQWLGGTGSSTLSINAEWNTNSFSTKTVSVSSSDIRLKDCIKDTSVDALYFIKQIRTRSFRWKEDDKFQRIGVIADELEKLDPMLVVGGGEDEEGNPIYKSVNNLLLISYLTKAVQQLSDKVDTLSAELASLREETK